MSLCFATNNAHKIAEVKAILGNDFSLLSLQEIGCHEELPETENTIEGNSLQKAAYVLTNYNISCFADDSGLEVAALDNAPGVHSAYYGGPQRSHADNMALLLKNLSDKKDRQAQFKTVITLAWPGGRRQFEGILQGKILKEKRGSGGFGYDPLFLPDGFNRTLAEMTSGEKNGISHRSKAVKHLVNFLKTNTLS